MIQFLRTIYVSQRFFPTLFLMAAGFLFSFWYPELYAWVWVSTILFLIIFLFDIIALYKKKSISAERKLPEKFSNSDENPVLISIRNRYPFTMYVEIIDEIPVQFQKRDFLKKLTIPQGQKIEFEYHLRPVERGEYFFGYLHVYGSTKIGLAKRRYSFNKEQMVKVYPSFIQMKKYDFLAVDNKIPQIGLKKIRKIGHTMEFEQIRDYVAGDDFRTINWKASAKQGSLMTNQFQDEKSQPVYSIIDVSRSMKMPFNNLKLLDYAINSSLAFSNIALKKKDKIGLLTFSNKISSFIPAVNKKTHLITLMEGLYNINTQFSDSDYGLIYTHLKKKVTQRSLLMLYTNFEHISSLERQLPYLLAISKKHLVVVIFFENVELQTLLNNQTECIPEIFDQTIAEEFLYQKRLMVKELHKYGIQSILTKPEDLSVNAINKYLEIKSRGLL